MYGDNQYYGGTIQETDPTVDTSSIDGTLYLGGEAAGAIVPILQTAVSKTYVYKIYDGDFNYLGRWTDVITPFGYSQEINSAGSAIDIVLARNSDTIVRNYEALADDSGDPIITDDGDEIIAETTSANAIGPGSTVDLNLNVKVYVFPETADSLDDIEGTLIFTGYISKYVSNYGQDENTKVTLFSYGADLDNYALLDNDGNTRVPFLSVDPSSIIKTGLDAFNADGGISSYNQGGTTIDLTSTEVSYTFNVNTLLEVLKKSLELAPTDWFWWYDMALNNVHFHTKPADPDHIFVLGKHILSLNLEKYIEDIVNDVFYTGGVLNPFIQDAFADTTGTLLTAHVGAIGATWNRHPQSNATGNWKIDASGRAYTDSGNDLIFVATGESLSDDYKIKADITQVTSTAGEYCLIGRVHPTAKTFYMARYINNSTDIHLYKCIAGTFTDLGTGSFTPVTGTPFTLEMEMIGSKITVRANNSTMVEATDSAILTGKISGVRSNSGGSDDSTHGGRVDNYIATSDLNSKTNLFKHYTDVTSINNYRRGLARPTDNRVKLEDSADTIATSLINRGKEPRYRSSVTIPDRVYNIESIQLGQLIGFRNFGNFIDGLTMQIVRRDYRPEAITLQLDTLLPSVPKRLEDIKRNLDQSDVTNNPDAPVV